MELNELIKAYFWACKNFEREFSEYWRDSIKFWLKRINNELKGKN